MKEQYTETEIKIFKNLASPKKIQDFLETIAINFEEDGDTCMSPRMVLRTKKAHCIEGAFFAAAALEFHGEKPLVMHLSASVYDYDHVVAVFKQYGCYGAISKTNHGVLRYREPIYKNSRELALSFFHEYFSDDGKKSLRAHSDFVDLNKFNKFNWRASEKDLWDVSLGLHYSKHYSLMSKSQIMNLRKADPLEIEIGKIVEYKEQKTS